MCVKLKTEGKTMKKLTSLLLAGILGTALLAGCSNGSAPADETASEGGSDANTETVSTSLQDIKDRGYFILGLDADFAPMGFTEDDGTIVGFDIDLANEVAKRMGVEVEVKPIDWDSKNLELSSGKIDVIWNGFSITEERKQEVLFSDPYLSTGQVIVVPTDSAIQTKADLAGKKVALQDGSTSEEALKKDTATYESIGDDNISRFKENSQVLMEVQSGRADAAVIDEIFVRYYLTKENLADQFRVLEEQLDPEDYAVGGRLGDDEFMNAINEGLAECKADGTLSSISQKWFGEDITK